MRRDFKRADIGSRDVGTEIAESAEENRDVTRPNGDRAAVLFDRPTALVDQPSNESSDRLREGFIDAPIDDLADSPHMASEPAARPKSAVR